MTAHNSNAVLAFPAAPPQPTTTPEPQQRPVLKVITGGTKRKTAWFLLSYIIPVLAAVIIILGINVAVSSHQYDVVRMKQEQLGLIQENEALTQQMKNLQAPQNLASEAAQLGMVMPSSVGSIDVENQVVQGNPAPAKKSAKPTTWVSKPGVAASSEPVVVKTAPKPPGTTSNSATDKKPSATLPEANLNGGTIPAPKQK